MKSLISDCARGKFDITRMSNGKGGTVTNENLIRSGGDICEHASVISHVICGTGV